MILGKEFRESGGSSGPTISMLLDQLAQSQPGKIALRDAPNRSSIISGAARSYTFQSLNDEVDKLANQFIALGLATDSVIALHLPNTSEAAVALLAVLKAGMIAAPIPIGWGRREIVAHLQRVGARGIVTMSRTGAIDTADMMRHAAAMVFSVRLVCAYGQPVLDGVMPLDDMLADGEPALPVVIERSEEPSRHVAIVTADLEASGHIATARNHAQWIAAGTIFANELGLNSNSRLAACLACDNLGGIASQIMPWLLTGCEMEVHPPFAARVFQAALKQGSFSHCVLPVKAAGVVLELDNLDLDRVLLVARTHDDIAVATQIMSSSSRFQTVFVAGETAACAISQKSGELDVDPSTKVIVTPRETLAFSGPMVPVHAFPPGAERATSGVLSVDGDGFLDSGFPGKMIDRKPVVTGAPVGILAVGGRRFSESEISAVYQEAGGEIRPVVKPDAVLGHRVTGVIGHGRGMAGLAGRLERSGLTSLAIPGATRYGGQIPFEDTTPPAALEQTEEQRAHIIKQLLTG